MHQVHVQKSKMLISSVTCLKLISLMIYNIIETYYNWIMYVKKLLSMRYYNIDILVRSLFLIICKNNIFLQIVLLDFTVFIIIIIYFVPKHSMKSLLPCFIRWSSFALFLLRACFIESKHCCLGSSSNPKTLFSFLKILRFYC